MSKEVIEIRKKPIIFEHRKRVAAYARVSTSKDTMLQSLAAQINYYRQKILGNPEWLFAGVYADEGKSGTRDDREQFQALLAKCRTGEIDMIVTKSISRFARNTVTLLQTVRELKSYSVDVYFEEQNIHTISSDGELLLTLLASFAQAESMSVSENCKWRIRHMFRDGQSTPFIMLGYRLIHGQTVVIPGEAAIVRRIFGLYMEGCGTQRIANILNAEGLRTVTGGVWYSSKVGLILDNEKYCGDLLLQKTFVGDHLKREKKNCGELPRYLIENDHEAIIDKPLFQRVAAERDRRAVRRGIKAESHVFSGKIRCECCGKNYRRKTINGAIKWCCDTYNKKGKQFCPDSKMIPETTLINAVCAVLGTESFDEKEFRSDVDYINACTGNTLLFHFTNGKIQTHIWQDRSRAESWTAEMRVAARECKLRGLRHGK